MITAVIIDDEPRVIESLTLLLAESCPDVAIAGTADGFETGTRLLAEKAPELVFLDIEMPRGSGFDLLERFPDRTFHVVFVTAHSEHAIRAFKFSAIDYLLKPVDTQQLVQAVDRIRRHGPTRSSSLQRHRVLEENLKSAGPTRLAVPTSEGFEFVVIADILRIQAEDRYSTLHLLGGRRILVARNLGEFSRLLEEEGFFRAHHSHLINLDRVTRYLHRDGGTIVLADGSKVPLARERKKDFLKRAHARP